MTVNFIWQSYLHLLCLLKNAHGSGELSEYEKKRLENIRQNSEFFDGLQLTEVMTVLLCHFAFAYTHIFIFIFIYIYIYIYIYISEEYLVIRSVGPRSLTMHQNIKAYHTSVKKSGNTNTSEQTELWNAYSLCVGDLVPLYLLCWNPAWEVQVIVLCSWTKHTHTVPLFTQEFKWVPANCQRILMKFWGKGG